VRTHTTTTITITRRVVLAVVLAAVTLPACSSGGPSGARAAADRFLAAWSKGDLRAAAAVTDDAVAARTGLQKWKTALGVSRAGFRALSADESGDAGEARFAAAVSLNGLGFWRYQSRLPLRRLRGKW